MESLIIVGADRTGKSIIGEHLKRNGYFVIELGELVREEYLRNKHKGSVSSFYDEFRNSYLDEIIIKEIQSIVASTTNDSFKIAIIGIRSTDLLNNIQVLFERNMTIYIESDFQLRFQRYLSKLKSRKNEPVLDKASFKFQDATQITWGLLEIKKHSDYIIDNNDKGKNELFKKIDEILKK